MKLNLYKIWAEKDQKTYYVYAKEAGDAEALVINENYREILDDDLSDLFETVEVLDPMIVSEEIDL